MSIDKRARKRMTACGINHLVVSTTKRGKKKQG
jgi:hypothetical protein